MIGEDSCCARHASLQWLLFSLTLFRPCTEAYQNGQLVEVLEAAISS